jgi:hypothetical protein
LASGFANDLSTELAIGLSLLGLACPGDSGDHYIEQRNISKLEIRS